MPRCQCHPNAQLQQWKRILSGPHRKGQLSTGAEIFRELFSFILGMIFFLWFQLEVETFRCRGGRPLKKGAGGGLGGRAKRLPPRCIRRTCYVICLRFVEFWGLVFTICCWFTEMFIKDFGPLVSYLLGGLRLFGALGSYSFWGLLGSLKGAVFTKLVVSLKSEFFLSLRFSFFWCCAFRIFWWSQAHTSCGF